MKRISNEKTILQRILCVLLSCTLTISMVPTGAFAELAEAESGAVADAQVNVEAQADDSTAELDGENASDEEQPSADDEPSVESQQGTATEDQGETAANQAEAADSQETEPTAESADAQDPEPTAETTDAEESGLTTQATKNETISFSSGLPSESNVRKDLYVQVEYTDDFFKEKSSVYNDDLAYASACLAAAADNSNESNKDNDYSYKAKNVVSFLQNIGCQDIRINDGYKYQPLTESNIGVAIGYKDITVNENGADKKYRLFVFGIRGGGYEQEWAVNMRIGTKGDAQGFQEARDGALGFIMPYIENHTREHDYNVKIWGSGYCRGGTTTNMVMGWINKWVYERNNGHTYKNLAYTDSYNKDHTVYGLEGTYDPYEALKYTGLLTIDPAKDAQLHHKASEYDVVYIQDDGEIEGGDQFSNDDLYAYPVNCPYGVEASDAENYEGLMTGVHNLINPDDWFPQVIMHWFGFKRYGYSHDHDLTGTYENDCDLTTRDIKKVVCSSDRRSRDADGNLSQCIDRTARRIAQLDPGTVFKEHLFNQLYFSKQSVIDNLAYNVSTWARNLFRKKNNQIGYMDTIMISADVNGEGNRFFSVGKSVGNNQGAYFEEFMRFFLAAQGFDDGGYGSGNRELYTDKYERPLFNLCRWVLGSPLEAREKFAGVATKYANEYFTTKRLVKEDNKIINMLSGIVDSKFMVITTQILCVVFQYNIEEPPTLIDMLEYTFDESLNELGIYHSGDDVRELAKTLTRLIMRLYREEQKLGKFNFYHILTVASAGAGIAQSHWPEQSLAWFNQFKVGSREVFDKNSLTSLSEQADGLSTQDDADDEDEFQLIYYDPFDDTYYDGGTRDDGEIIGAFTLSDTLRSEGYTVKWWNIYDANNFDSANLEANCVGSVDASYPLTTTDKEINFPETMILVPEYEQAQYKHVNLWLNKTADGFSQDVKIAEFDVYEGGDHCIAYSKPPYEEDIYKEFDMTYYGDNDNLPNRAGLSLMGWVSEGDVNDVDSLTMFAPDSYVSYEDLPEGDTINLYGAWYDRVAYGITYHANRSSSDTYVTQDAQWASDDDTLVLEGFAEGDEGLQNDGKKLVGWNTKADGTGTWYEMGQTPTIAQLGLGTREGYVSDLEDLATLEEGTLTSFEDEEVDEAALAAAVAKETELEEKYTVHLYAQWKATDESTPAPAPNPDSDQTPKAPTGGASLPKTGDERSMAPELALVGGALVVMGSALAIGRRRRKTA